MITIQYIKDTVEKYFDLPPGSVDLKTSEDDIVLARQICQWIAKRKIGCSNKKIGKEIGNVGHNTVGHSIIKINGHYRSKDYIDNYIEEISILLSDTKTKINKISDNTEIISKKAQIMCLLTDIYGDNSLQKKLVESIFCCD